MDQRFIVLTTIFLTLLVSGCSGGGGQKVDNQGDKAIAVHELSVTPSEIFAGSNVRVRMSLSNVGELPAKVLISNESRNKGMKILTNHCPDIFDIKSFSASSSNVSSTQASYVLKPDYKVRLNWNLAQNSDDVPLNGYKCNMNFQVPFNYSVNAFKQIQVKKNPDVKGSKKLFAKSSKGPLKIELEAIGSSAPRGAPTFLKNDSGEILIQLVNKKPKETSFSGTVSLAPPKLKARGIKFGKINVSGSPTAAERRLARRMPGVSVSDLSSSEARLCPDPEDIPDSGQIQLYQGQSKVFRCDLDWSHIGFGITPSIKGEVFASTNYTYIKNVGTRSVKVRYRGN